MHKLKPITLIYFLSLLIICAFWIVTNHPPVTAALDCSTFYKPSTNYDVGNAPTAIASGDLNSDGFTDLAVANFTDNTVSILYGSASGTFTPSSLAPVVVGSHPIAISLFDFNRDNKLEIVTANYDSDNISIASESPTTPGLYTAINYAVGSKPRALLVDTNVIFVANYGSNDVSRIRRDTNGVVLPSENFAVGINPIAISSIYYNYSSNTIVVANYGSQNLIILDKNTFNIVATLPLGKAPIAIFIKEFNNDAYEDIALAFENDPAISIYINNLGNGFVTPHIVTTQQPIASLSAIKLNDDGYADLIVTHSTNNTLEIIFGTEFVSFGSSLSLNTGSEPTGLLVNDLNQDAKFDIVTTNKNSNNLSVLLNDRKLSGLTIQVAATTSSGKEIPVTIAAVDNCGNLDASYQATVSFSSSDTSAVLPPNYTFGNPSEGIDILKATFNTSGNQTITVKDTTNPTLTGTASFVVKNGSGSITVTSLNDSSIQSCTLRDAIAAANTDSVVGNCQAGNGFDNITFTPTLTGTISLQSSLPDITTGMAIKGLGTDRIILSRNPSAATKFRLFNVVTDGLLEISDLTLKSGDLSNTNESGGGLKNRAGTVKISNVIFTENITGFYGGGLYNDSGVVEISNSTFSNNTGVPLYNSASGAGIYMRGYNARLTIDNSLITNNHLNILGTATGGGVRNNKGSVLIRNTTITNNTLAYTPNSGVRLGGGIFNGGPGNSTIINSLIANNETEGIYNYRGTVNLINSTVSDNLYTGLENSYEGIANIRNSTLVANGSNRDYTNGNIINIFQQSMTIKNSIVASPAGPGDCYNSPFVDLGYNLHYQNYCNFYAPTSITANPLLDTLKNNGGPTQTRAIPVNSPALNAGDPTGCTDAANSPLTTDQRGYARPYAGRCDIGAFEYNGLTPQLRLGAPATITEFREEKGAVAVVDAAGLLVTDGDNSYLAGAVITLVGQQNGTAEVLSVNTQGTSIAASYNNVTGVLTLSGSDGLSNYQQVLRSLQYNNTALYPTSSNRTISITVSDGFNTSASITTNLVLHSALVVSVKDDNGLHDTFGTFSYALSHASNPLRLVKEVSFEDKITQVNLLWGSLPPLGSGISVLGRCNGEPTLIINGGGNNTDGLVLRGGNRLYGLLIKNFGGTPLVVVAQNGKNELNCVRISK